MKLAVRITPNAKRSEILGFEEDVLRIKIAAPAVDGKANAELTRFLAKTAGIAKSEITIVKGKSARIKMIELPEAAAKNIKTMVVVCAS